MKSKLRRTKRMRKILLASTLLTTGLSEFFPHQAQAQIVWESVDTPKAKPSSVKWETISEEKKHDVPQKDQVVPELDELITLINGCLEGT